MKLIETKSGVIDASVDALVESARSISEEFPAKAPESMDIAEDFLRLDLQDLLQILERRDFTHLKSIRALAAHGKSDTSGNFWYIDRTVRDETAPFVPVQTWVNTHDGGYGALLIYPCNLAGVRLSSTASFLVYAKQGVFSSEDVKNARWNRESNLLFQPPKHG